MANCQEIEQHPLFVTMMACGHKLCEDLTKLGEMGPVVDSASATGLFVYPMQSKEDC
jgi:hypothetical protein